MLTASMRHSCKSTIPVLLLIAATCLPMLAKASPQQGPLLPYYDLPIAQHPESVTFDPVQRAFYAGSILAKGIVKVDGPTGTVSQFIEAGELPFLAITGLRADPVGRRLWVCNVEPSAFIAYAAGGGPAEAVQSGLALLDLDTGDLLAYHPLALVPGAGLPGFLCNDITVDAAGYAYATESIGGRVLRFPPDGGMARH